MQKSTTQGLGWHNEAWGMWGWIETILKLVGIVAAINLFTQTSGATGLVIGGNPHLAGVVLLALMTLVAFGVIYVRYTQKEILSFVFAIVNALGHLALLIALLRVPPSTTLGVLFGLMYVLGAAAKIRFLGLTGYTEGGADVKQMKRVTAIMGIIYIAFTVLVLL